MGCAAFSIRQLSVEVMFEERHQEVREPGVQPPQGRPRQAEETTRTQGVMQEHA